MLKSNASRLVLVLLLAIGALELGISGRFTQLWQLAFSSGAAGTPSSSASSSSSATAQPMQSGSRPTLR